MLITIHHENPEPRKIQQAVEILKKGGLVVYPTDSVYSICCALSEHKAVIKLAQIKGVKPEKANFSLICKDLSHLSSYAKQVNTNIYKLMKRALPGPYTFILNASGLVPKIFKAKKKTIGIRVPDNKIALALVQELGEPLVSTSVHNSEDTMREYITDPELIHEHYGGQVTAVIDGGMGRLEASTVFDCTQNEAELIREGLGPVEGLL